MFAWEEGCNIAIWGTGVWGKRMYHKYKAHYQVSCFIDNFLKQDSMYGLPVLHGDKIGKLKCKILIAVSKYESICIQCEQAGKQFYKDYLPYDFFKSQQLPIIPLYRLVKEDIKKYYYAFLQEKKSVLIIGNCQTPIIQSCMTGSSQFEKEYLFITIPLVWMLTQDDYEVLQKCNFIFKESDLIITQHISNMAGGILGTENLLKMVGEHTKIVYIPNLWFDCYYPQHTHQHIKVELGGGVYAFPYADSIIDELIKRYSVHDVIKIVKCHNLFSQKFLNDLYEYRISSLAEREKQCDIKMLDYIISNWKKELLFYSVNHPSNNVIFEETKRLLKYLGYSDFKSEKIDTYELNLCQVIIYPSVKLNYGLEFTHEFYKDVCLEGKKDIDEYIMQYVSYIHPQQLRKQYLS